MKQAEIEKLIKLQGQCGYNDSNKREFRRLGTKLARALRAELVPEGTAEVRFNAGGIAVSGDVILHCPTMYLRFNADGMGLGIMYRHCNGLKDCGAGVSTPNHWYRWEQLSREGVAGFVSVLRQFSQTKCKADNMRCMGHEAIVFSTGD